MLFAHEVPVSGGDTVFASMYKAYDTLSDGLKSTLGNLRARHSSVHVFGAARAEKVMMTLLGELKIQKQQHKKLYIQSLSFTLRPVGSHYM